MIISEEYLQKLKSEALSQKAQLIHLGQCIEGKESDVDTLNGKIDVLDTLLWKFFKNPYRVTWTTMPTSFGFYFFCKELKDWDLSKVVRVSKHTFCDDIVKFFDDKGVEITKDTGFWQGPFIPERPIK